MLAAFNSAKDTKQEVVRPTYVSLVDVILPIVFEAIQMVSLKLCVVTYVRSEI